MVKPTPGAAWLIAGLIPVLALAAPAYDPEAPVPALQYAPLTETRPPLPATGERDWRSANDTVGAYTRGHIDILKWEAENLPAAAPEDAPANPALSPEAALQAALAGRPDLFARADMSAAERARADIAMIEFGREVHRAWIGAVAARENLRHAQRAFDAADIAAGLAVRMTEVGNWGQDRLLREQLARHEAGLELARAHQEETRARETLLRKLGWWGGKATTLELAAHLPELPEAPLGAAELEATALRAHPRLKLAAIDAERLQRGLGGQSLEAWDRATREAIAAIASPDAAAGHPLTQRVTAAPVIDLRRAALGHDAERAAGARAEATALAVTIRSNVREAYHQYRIAHELALQAGHTLQLRVAVQEDMLLRYNGMLKSTWDLLAAARDRVAGEAAAVAALRDFWLAHANLQAVLAGGDYAGPDAIGAVGARNNAGGGH